MNYTLVSLLICALLCIVSTWAKPQVGWEERRPFQRPQRPFRPADNGGNNQNPFFSTTTQQPPVDSTTAATVTTPSPQFYACMQNCPTTSEYNPVCGTDNQNYHNNARLECAKRCGANVSAVRSGTCQGL